MDRRDHAATVTSLVADAITRAGANPSSVARAADITPAELEDRLANRQEFSVLELMGVGGFLRIHPAALIEAAA